MVDTARERGVEAVRHVAGNTGQQPRDQSRCRPGIRDRAITDQVNQCRISHVLADQIHQLDRAAIAEVQANGKEVLVQEHLAIGRLVLGHFDRDDGCTKCSGVSDVSKPQRVRTARALAYGETEYFQTRV